MTRSVDIQGHYMPDAHWRGLKQLAERSPDFERLVGIVVAAAADSSSRVRRVDDARVAEMDEAGLDVMVLSLLPPGVGFGGAAEAAALARESNDELIEAGARYPDRFLALASVPLPHVAEAIAEVERVAAKPAVRGIQLFADVNEWTLDEARFEPLYARIAELGLLAVLHPSLEQLPHGYNAWGLGSSIGTMVSTTLAGLRLIFSGMLDRVPDLELVIPHLGGTIPYLTRRVMDLNGKGGAEHDLPHYLRTRIYYDSCSYQPEALTCAIDTVGGDRIMLGSDYPFRGDLSVCVEDIQTADIPDETRSAILGTTAERWFGAAATV
jgi:predicted TIM-barrel fold metal-dependent hydrolase